MQYETSLIIWICRPQQQKLTQNANITHSKKKMHPLGDSCVLFSKIISQFYSACFNGKSESQKLQSMPVIFILSLLNFWFLGMFTLRQRLNCHFLSYNALLGSRIFTNTITILYQHRECVMNIQTNCGPVPNSKSDEELMLVWTVKSSRRIKNLNMNTRTEED